MQGSVFRQWYGTRRFMIAIIMIAIVLLVTLGVAIYSYISAFNAVTHLNAIDVQASLITPTATQDQITAPASDPVRSQPATNESGANVNASISTNSNSTTPSVTVNGTPVEVPSNGTTQQQISTDQGNVNVQVQSSSNTSDSTANNSNLRVTLHSSSTTSGGN